MKPTVSRIFRVVAVVGIGILCVIMLLTQTMKSASDKDEVNDEVERGRANKNYDVITHRRPKRLKFWSRKQTNDVDEQKDRKHTSDADEQKSKQPGQEEIDFDLRAGGRFSIGSGGDPGFIELPVSAVLVPDLIQPDVHFLWCGSKWFEFKNYLSVMSVRRIIQPDKIYIHYEQELSVDRVNYNQWLDELKHEYPWLYMRQMGPYLGRYCANPIDRQLRIRLITELLSADFGGGGGGIYVGSSTWLVNFPPSMRSVDLDIALDEDAAEGYVVLRDGVVNSSTSDPDGGIQRALQATDVNRIRRRSSCARIHHVYRQPDIVNQSRLCFIVTGEGFNRFFPADIWELDDEFGRLARRLFYGTEAIRRPTPTYDTLVPNIGHMIWLGGGRMSYVFYLSVVSLLYVAEVEKVYIHGNLPPSGEYWDQLMTQPQTKDKVKFIKRTLPLEVYQGSIPPWWAALQSDLIRVDLMIKYGGIYTDTDAIWVQPLSAKERGYDAVASYDWVDWSWPFPDSVNFGVSYGKRTAPFWRIFRDSMRKLRNDIHGFTGVMMPYKLLEKYPDLLYIDKRLQVICYHSRCHPTYVNDYHNMSKDHTNMNYLQNWREDVHAFHWTFPDPPELLNRTNLLQSTGLFADLGRFVLQKAGLL